MYTRIYFPFRTKDSIFVKIYNLLSNNGFPVCVCARVCVCVCVCV